MKQNRYDVIVIGAGHAGSEAAHACHRAGLKVLLVTMKKEDIGALSCNPAIGGVGKGHLVREIDVMGGIIGRVGDLSAIHYRLLNRRKGRAVRGPRAQMDRDLYQRHMNHCLYASGNIEILFAEVTELIVENEDTVSGIIISTGQRLSSDAVIITTGTFLGACIFIGEESFDSGRMGDRASQRLKDQFSAFPVTQGRLKTGTPPRLAADTIDLSKTDVQETETNPAFLSYTSASVENKQVNCSITHTNSKTHDIIRKNLDKSAIYGGKVDSVGPRYCPSIEDKVVRFHDKDQHQVFLEPEGLTSGLVYPNGISTSLPREVQVEYIQSINGLENAEIKQFGYAVEYSYFDPRNLDQNLAVKGLNGLFFAGQINGTTGYEEAAAQGLAAAVGVILRREGDSRVFFERSNSYIGVMIDDLTRKGVTEPYRMFTSRAEFRLHLRYDNAYDRLFEHGSSLGLIDHERASQFSEMLNQDAHARSTLERHVFTPTELKHRNIGVKQDGRRRSVLSMLADSSIDFATASELVPELSPEIADTVEKVASDEIYGRYVKRQLSQYNRTQAGAAMKIPRGFDFKRVAGLSGELVEKLVRIEPKDIGEASDIEGMTPSAIVLLMGHLNVKAEISAL